MLLHMGAKINATKPEMVIIQKRPQIQRNIKKLQMEVSEQTTTHIKELKHQREIEN